MLKKQNKILISKAISFVFNEKLDYVFKNKSLIEKTTVISFNDSQIFLFKNNEEPITIPHEEKILEKTKEGWSAYLRQKEDLGKYLPKKTLANEIISGGLYSDFLKYQKKKKSIYTTKQSYISTIVHEYAHVYFNKLNPFYYAEKEYTLKLLDISKDLYLGKNISKDYKLLLPSYRDLSEVFAFCVEYDFAKKYAKKHFEKINADFLKRIDSLKKIEKGKDFKKEDSILSDPHIYSWVFGKMILEKYGDDWVERLLERREI